MPDRRSPWPSSEPAGSLPAQGGSLRFGRASLRTFAERTNPAALGTAIVPDMLRRDDRRLFVALVLHVRLRPFSHDRTPKELQRYPRAFSDSTVSASGLGAATVSGTPRRASACSSFASVACGARLWHSAGSDARS